MAAFRVIVRLASLALLFAVCHPLWAQTPVPQKLQVPLFPEFDLYGNQFEVVQAYENSSGQRSITAGIYDTGASVVTFSVLDQGFFFEYQGQPQIPIIPGAVATADAIGGSLEGQVSAPGKILAAGASAINIDFNTFSFDFDLTGAVSVGGIQAMIGTTLGSPNLPSIVGTPINIPSASNPNGLATVMDQSGYTLDLGALNPALAGIPFHFPDVRFVQPGASLETSANTYESVSIPVSLYGIDNTGNPGNDISSAPNPMQHNTGVSFTPSAAGSVTNSVADQSFLFDTGAQISVISPAIAQELGLIDSLGNFLETPFDVIDVQGAGSTVAGLPGFVLDTLSMPRLDGGTLEFTDVPVYVLDVGFGIDGILGLNLFNGADSFIYDPYNPSGAQFSAVFLNDRSLETIVDEADAFATLNALELELLSTLGIRYAIANPLIPGVRQVPEPSTWILALIGIAALGFHQRRKFIRH